MATFGTDERGALDDRVRLELGNDEVLVAETYEVSTGVLSQPAAFALRLGHGGVIRDLVKKYPPKTPFRLFVGSVLQQSGETDGFRVSSSAGASQMTIRGRDGLAPLHDGYVATEFSFHDETYKTLVERALKEVGITQVVTTSGYADRQIKAGVKLIELQPPKTIVDVVIDRDAFSPRAASSASQFQTKMGERWYDFVRRHLDRAGLFLWAGADGKFILSRPNRDQKAAYRVLRKRGSKEASNIIEASWTNETTQRFSECVVTGRSGGKKFGRTKHSGAFTDPEMEGYGYKRLRTLRDTNVQTIAQAEYLAARALSEAARRGFALEYTLAGHTTPALGTRERAVWTPDTIVEVDDDEFGLHGNFYIENVEHRRSPQTTTTLRLMNPLHLLFGADS